MARHEKKLNLHFPEGMTVSENLKNQPTGKLMPPLRPLETLALQSDNADLLLQESDYPHFYFLFLQCDVHEPIEIGASSEKEGFFFLMGIRGKASWNVAGHTAPVHCPRGQQLGFSAPAGNHSWNLEAGLHQFVLVYASAHLSMLIAAEWPALCQPKLPSCMYSQASIGLIAKLAGNDKTHWSLLRMLEDTIYALLRNYAKDVGKVQQQQNKDKTSLRERAMAYIREHFMDPELTNAVVADALNVSESSLEKAFNPGYISMYSYTQALRLFKAGEWLTSTDRPIREIGLDAGFADPSNFNKAFKKRFLKSPSQWRIDTRDTGNGEIP